MNLVASVATGSKPRMEQLALLLVLATETVFFGTLLMAYLDLRGSTSVWPAFSHSGDRLALPAANLAVLWAAAAAAGYALRAARRVSPIGPQSALWLNLGFGLTFLVGQVVEVSASGLRPGDSAFAGLFFTLLGFHALHLLAGLVLQGINLGRARAGDFSPRKLGPLWAGMGLWWYGLAVWLVLFVVLYLA